MKIIITGGTGFVGTNLCIFLLQQKQVKKILLIDNFKSSSKKNLYAIKEKDNKKKIYFIKASICEEKTFAKINKIFKKSDIVIHLAAQSSGENSFYEPIYDINTNINGTLNILNWSKKLNVNYFIYSSTMSVYGNKKTDRAVNEKSATKPTSLYGNSKLISENLIKEFCKNYKINYTIFRLFNIYGQYQDLDNLKQGMLSIYLAYLLRNKKLIIKGSLNRYRDFLHVDDLVKAFWLSIQKKPNNKIYNLGTGKSTKVSKLINLMMKYLNINKHKYKIEIQKSTPGDIKGFISEIKKIKKSLNWVPVINIEEGLKKTIKFYK